MIPRILHLIWIGDQTKFPGKWTRSWREYHPDWQIHTWGNWFYKSMNWTCKKQMEDYWNAGRFEGVADIMRYEILYRFGGFYADADSECLRPIPDKWRLANLIAMYESETHRPGLVANGFIGSEVRSPVMRDLIDRIAAMDNPLKVKGRKRQAWQVTGPKLFTEVIKSHTNNVHILPSKKMYPTHFLDTVGGDESEAVARQHWGTTKGIY